MFNNYICALDIGSSKISAVLAETKNGRLKNLYLETTPSKDVKNGLIVDSIGLMESISWILKNLKAKSGLKIKFVYANLSGRDINFRHSQAIIPLAERGNKVITYSDIIKVAQQALILGSNIDEEVVHKIPFSYSVDNKSNIVNPIGLYGHRFEADLYLVCIKLSSLQTLVHVLNQAGYEVRDLFFTGVATSKVVFDDDLKKGVNIFCDMGSDITELLLFKDGLLKNIELLPFGGNSFTEAISKELNISFDLAEEIKISYGIITETDYLKEDKEVLLKKEGFYKPIQQKAVCNIITSKAKTICQALKNSIEKQVLPGEVDNFIACGRTVLQEGFLEMLETSLNISAQLGRINNPHITPFINRYDSLSGQRSIPYLSSLGIICQALEPEQPLLTSQTTFTKNPIGKLINKAQEIYQEYF